MRRWWWLGLAGLVGCASGGGARVEAPPAAALEAGAKLEIEGATFTPPAGWVVEEPSNTFRAAQLRLPSGAEGVEDASLVIFYFGAQGAGSVEENLKRWRAQFEGAEGGEAVREERSGVVVYTVDLAGTYIAETSPGSGVRERRAGYRLLGSIVQARSGEYYLKLIGPAAVVARWAESYRAFVGSVEVRPGVDPQTTARVGW